LQPLAIVEFSEFVAATLASLPVPMVWQYRPAVARLREGFGRAPAERFEQVPMIDVTPAPLAVVSFAAVVENWAKFQKPTKESIDNARMVFRHFAAFLKHDDAARLTPDDMAAYDVELLETKTAPTAKKYLAFIKAALKLAKGKRLITANPCDGVEFGSKQSQTEERHFTGEEMALMVAEARKSDKAVVRIPVLIAAYSGACLGEIIDSHKRDFEVRADSLVFHIRTDNRTEGQTLKTEFRARRFPLHSSIVPDVLAYLDTIEDGPLFPNIAIDRFGKRAKNAGEHLRKWIKGLGINRKGTGFHAFRHTAKTAYRAVLPNGEDIRNYLTGHATKGSAADYGKFPKLVELVESLPANPLDWELE
jgi:integrase